MHSCLDHPINLLQAPHLNLQRAPRLINPALPFTLPSVSSAVRILDKIWFSFTLYYQWWSLIWGAPGESKKGGPPMINCSRYNVLRSSHSAEGEHFNKQTNKHDKVNINLAIIVNFASLFRPITCLILQVPLTLSVLNLDRAGVTS